MNFCAGLKEETFILNIVRHVHASLVLTFLHLFSFDLILCAQSLNLNTYFLIPCILVLNKIKTLASDIDNIDITSVMLLS